MSTGQRARPTTAWLTRTIRIWSISKQRRPSGTICEQYRKKIKNFEKKIEKNFEKKLKKNLENFEKKLENFEKKIRKH